MLEDMFGSETISHGLAKSVIEQERNDYGLTPFQRKSEVSGLLRSYNPFNLDFMVEEDEDDIEEYSN